MHRTSSGEIEKVVDMLTSLIRGAHVRMGVAFGLCCVAGCASIMTRNVDRAALARFQESPASRAEVERVLGRPFVTGTINEKLSAQYKVRQHGVPPPAPGRSPWQCPYEEKFEKVIVFYTASGMVCSFSSVFSGGHIQRRYVDRLQKGVSTRRAVHRLFGEPNQTMFESEGTLKDVWLYVDSVSDADKQAKGRQSSYKRSGITLQSKYQRLELTFDSQRILQNVVNDDSSSVTSINTDKSRHRLAPFDMGTINQLKSKRPSRDQVARLLGEPDSTTKYISGDYDYLYSRCFDDVFQSVFIQFSSAGNAKLFRCTQGGIATQNGPGEVKSVHVFAQSLRLAFLLAGRASKIAPSTYVGDLARDSTSVSGEQVDKDKLQSLTTGKSKPADVASAIGPPDSVEWSETGQVKSYGYLYNKSMTTTGFRNKSTSQCQMVTISFDDKGYLCDIKVDDMANRF